MVKVKVRVKANGKHVTSTKDSLDALNKWRILPPAIPRVVEAAFTAADVGRTASIKGDAVKVEGVARAVTWGDAKHHDCSGKIKSIEELPGGKVKLEDGHEFENGTAGVARASGHVASSPLEASSRKYEGDQD